MASLTAIASSREKQYSMISLIIVKKKQQNKAVVK